MREEDKCPELQKLYKFLELDKPIPEEFLAHARGCETRLFWLTHALAIQDVLRNTTRLFRNDNCPRRESFRDRLFVAAHSTRYDKLKISRKSARISCVISSTSEEFPDAIEFCLHLLECTDCHDYYDGIYAKMIAAQEKYEKAVREKESVRPIIEDTAEEINLARIPFLSSSPEGQKPN